MSIKKILESSNDVVRRWDVHRGVQYEPGLEDGIDFIDMEDLLDIRGNIIGDWSRIIRSYYGDDVLEDKTARIQLPYVITESGKKYIAQTDYFVVARNHLNILTEEEFEMEYDTLLDEGVERENHTIDLDKVAVVGYTMDADRLVKVIQEQQERFGKNPDRKILIVVPEDGMEPGESSSKVQDIYSIVGIGSLGLGRDATITLVAEKSKVMSKEDIVKETGSCGDHQCDCGCECEHEKEEVDCDKFEEYLKKEFIEHLLGEVVKTGLKNLTELTGEEDDLK